MDGQIDEKKDGQATDKQAELQLFRLMKGHTDYNSLTMHASYQKVAIN